MVNFFIEGHRFVFLSKIVARSAYYFRTGPFGKMCMFVCLSGDFMSFTEAENASPQRLLSHGTLTGKTSALLFRSEKLPSIKDL